MSYDEMVAACLSGSHTRLPHWPIDVYLVAKGEEIRLYNGSVHVEWEASAEEELADAWKVAPIGGGSW